jgi:hypothetical protein
MWVRFGRGVTQALPRRELLAAGKKLPRNGFQELRAAARLRQG